MYSPTKPRSLSAEHRQTGHTYRETTESAVIRRWATLSPPDRLIGACLAALSRLEATIAKPPPDFAPDEPPHTFNETGEVLFWLYAVGDTERGNLLSPGFQWARNQYAHGNFLSVGPVEFHYGATLGKLVLDAGKLDEPPLHRWTPRDYVGTHEKSRDHRKLTGQAETERLAQWTDYDNRLALQPVVATLWDELSELVALVSPRDLDRPRP